MAESDVHVDETQSDIIIRTLRLFPADPTPKPRYKIPVLPVDGEGTLKGSLEAEILGRQKANCTGICEILDATVTPIKRKEAGIPGTPLKTKEVSDCQIVEAWFELDIVNLIVDPKTPYCFERNVIRFDAVSM